jgi:phosphoribosylamine--glycine ligase
VFHAGTAAGPDGTVLTAGGRVLDVTATGPTIAHARTRAYAAVEQISWPGMQYRTDIAAEAVSAPGASPAPRR